MSEQIGQRNKWRDLYRLVILREETLEEVNSYKLTILNIYIFISTVLLILAALIVSLIFFSPIKKLVPGYGDPNENPAYIALFSKVQDMEKQLDAYEIYTTNFRKMVMGTDSLSNEQKASISPRIESIPVEDETVDTENINPFYNDFNNQIDGSTETKEMLEGNQLSSIESTAKSLDHIYLIPPLTGLISSGFDVEIDHFGVDVLAPKDTPVKAIMDGYVIASDWTLEAGNTIGIQHDNNVFSMYKHNAILLKKTGSFVHAGEAIALVGNTGKFTTGPHLHFELWQNGLPVDPEQYINFK